MTPEHIARAYFTLFPARLRAAHFALLTWAEGARPDAWPTPADVCRFARMYRVPRAELGGLVGMLARQPVAGRREVWTDAVRQRARATPDLIRQHGKKVLRAFGWFAHTTDLGWLRLPNTTVH